jgi:N-acetylmuramic acid 6-phosphate etherase
VTKRVRPSVTSLPVTERRNPRSAGLDQKSTLAILRIINREDARVPRAVARVIPQIVRVVDQVVKALEKGGRLIYVGAGSSGRMGALDAAEVPPTFGMRRDRVQAIMAGGPNAMWKAVEGAEDSVAAGAREIRDRRINKNDVVLGIAAVGTTPFVLGAMKEARHRGAFTAALTANRQSPLAKLARVTIAPDTGPEVLTGSTRMKAGTAQKLVLNMLSTAAMVRLDCVYDNLMINVARTNAKLRTRALRILQQAARIGAPQATEAMKNSRDDLRLAIVMSRTGAGHAEASARLKSARGNVRQAIAAHPSKRPTK